MHINAFFIQKSNQAVQDNPRINNILNINSMDAVIDAAIQGLGIAAMVKTTVNIYHLRFEYSWTFWKNTAALPTGQTDK